MYVSFFYYPENLLVWFQTLTNLPLGKVNSQPKDNKPHADNQTNLRLFISAHIYRSGKVLTRIYC